MRQTDKRVDMISKGPKRNLLKNFKRFAKRLIALLVVISISFLLLEQAVRFYLFGFDSFNYFKMDSIRELGISGLIKPSLYLQIVYEWKPNLNTYFKKARLKTNSQGLRDREYALKKPNRAFRVVVLGDSLTAGCGVAIEDVFHTILEERLNRESSGVLYEFINFGVGGYDPSQYLATLKLRAMAYNPDLALFCLREPSDNSFNPEVAFSHKYKVKPRSHPFYSSFFLALIMRNIHNIYVVKPYYFLPDFNVRRNKIFFRSMIQKNVEAENKNNKDVKNIEHVFSELSLLSKQNSLPICIVVLGLSADSEEAKESRDLAGKYGLYFVDTTMAFKNKQQSEYWIYKIDGHPNPKAHMVFAEIIYNYLKEQHFFKIAVE